MSFECPVCYHKAASYETLFRHVMAHKKLTLQPPLKRTEEIERKLKSLEDEVAEIKEGMKEART